MKRLAVFFLLIACAPAHAQKPDCANASSQTAMNICANQGAQKSEAALNNVYQVVMARLSPGGKVRLRDAQRAWLAFRSKECAFESSGSDGGSIAPMIALNCASSLADDRTKALAAFRTCQEGDLSCPN